jgi:hypothetical protein
MANRVDALCAEIAAKELLLVTETTSLDEHDAVVAKLNQCMKELTAKADKIELRRYGETFRCICCQKKQTINRKMSGHREWWDLRPQPCPVAMCYDCAMAHPDEKCKLCNQEFWYWEGGPAPYVTVRLILCGCYPHPKFYRLELDPATTTLGQVKDAMMPKIDEWNKCSSSGVFSSILVDDQPAKLEDKLCDLGVGETRITVHTKK